MVMASVRYFLPILRFMIPLSDDCSLPPHVGDWARMWLGIWLTDVIINMWAQSSVKKKTPFPAWELRTVWSAVNKSVQIILWLVTFVGETKLYNCHWRHSRHTSHSFSHWFVSIIWKRPPDFHNSTKECGWDRCVSRILFVVFPADLIRYHTFWNVFFSQKFKARSFNIYAWHFQPDASFTGSTSFMYGEKLMKAIWNDAHHDSS